MKLVNFNLQNQIETLSEEKSKEFFKNYIQQILEDTSKPYYQKADYVGLSLNELKNKIEYLSSSIKELQTLKKQLTESLDIAKVLTADVLIKNGVERIDGNIISSLTIQKESVKQTNIINILDENKVLGLGFVKFEVDMQSLEKHLLSKKGQEELKGLVEVIPMSITTPAKAKVNIKRKSSNNTKIDEILVLKEDVA